MILGKEQNQATIKKINKLVSGGNMKQFRKIIIVMLILVLVVVACGPSEEAIATMTASAWTPTPEPTLTPTPMPYDLELSLAGEEGESITFGVYVEAAGMEPVMMEETGLLSLLNLPGPDVELSITTQGYEPHTETVSLERGKNPVTLTLTADPLQINPATACAEGQKVLFIEDFEDGKAQEMTDITRPLFAFKEIEDRGTVLHYPEENTGVYGTRVKPGTEFSNFVWKFDVDNNKNLMMIQVQRTGGEGDSKAYNINYFPTGEGIHIFHAERGETKSSAHRGFNTLGWVNLAITFFEDSLEIYINDELYLALDDSDPLTSGGMGLEFIRDGAAVSIDNMVICELAEPYVPPLVEVAEE